MGVEKKRGGLYPVRVYNPKTGKMDYIKGHKERRRTLRDARALFEEMAERPDARPTPRPQVDHSQQPHSLYSCFSAGGELLYVGIASHAMSRLKQHERGAGWWQDVATIKIAHFPTREHALLAEAQAIANHHPRHNKIGKAGLLVLPTRPLSIEQRLAQADQILAQLREELDANKRTGVIDADG